MTNLLTIPQARAEAILWARARFADHRTVYLDTETTGIGPGAEIVDIGIVDSDGTELMNMLVKPKRPIPIEAQRVHGITDEAVANAPTWDEVGPIVREILAGKNVVIYNLQYDQPMLEQCNAECGLPSLDQVDRWHCAMLAYSAFDGEIGRFGSLKWHKLDRAADHFDIPQGGHRAFADADTARKVVMAMAYPTEAGNQS